ncbi:MAG: type II secretion system protein [bacterium]|nr:type II secretion system protein [bacterium]
MDSFSKTACKGYTLIEVVVALFIFLIIMTELSHTFAQSFATYKNAKAVQRDVANAQFVLNLLAKELRTSTIVDPSSGSLVSAQSVRFYDYSQSTCFEYVIVSNQLTVAQKTVANPTNNPSNDCSGGLGGAVPVVKIETAGGALTGQFIVTPSIPNPGGKVGKVTVSLEISEGPNHKARIQTTSSLRDYGYVGL